MRTIKVKAGCTIIILEPDEKIETSGRKKYSSNTTGYTGVTKVGNRYKAVVCYRGRFIYIGRFTTPELAAEAYNKKATELRGGTSLVNQINKKT